MPLGLERAARAAAAERYGARYVQGDVVALRRKSSTIEAVGLDDGRELSVDVVINATGPDAGWFAVMAGSTLPVDRAPGLLIVTTPAPVRLRHVLYTPGVNLRPDGGSRCMVQPEAMDMETAFMKLTAGVTA